MSNRIVIILALVVTAVMIALGLMSFHEGTAKTKPVIPPFDLFWCEKDEDCVRVARIGCCPCQQGGGETAVNQWRLDDLRRFLKHACRSEHVCVQVDLCHADARPRCLDRQCTLSFGND